MDFSFLIPLIFIFFVVSLFLMMMAAMGLSPGNILWFLAASRRYRTELAPRDHFDRWAHAHRRAGAPNKPKQLKYLMTTGDDRVPPNKIGQIKTIEPWRSFFVIFVRTRRFAWSVPHIVKQDVCSDIHRRHLWVTCRGFTGSGPIRYPIPPDGTPNIDTYIEEHIEAFRHSFEQLVYLDVTENMAWSVDHGMAPPIREQTRVTEADRPGITEQEYIPEDNKGVT